MAQRGGEHSLRAKHINPGNVIFSMFTAEELNDLCRVKITTSLTFDALGYPIPGGLYDKCLGPVSMRGDPCGTCHKNVHQCPGHYGGIQLPLPVVNPVFHKTISILLRNVCFTCHCLQIPTAVKHSISIQLKLLNCGMLTEAIEIQNRMADLIGQYQNFEAIPEEALESIRVYQSIAEEMSVNVESVTYNKNSEAIKNELIGGVFTGVKVRKRCIHCKSPLERVTVLKKKIIVNKKKAAGKDDTMTDRKQRITATYAEHISPEESRNIIRKIWKNDRELVLLLVPVLKDVQSEYPTDMFYFEMIPVPPSNVRPVNLMDGIISEHPQTKVYKVILQESKLLLAAIQVVKKDGDVEALPVETRQAYNMAKGKTPLEKLHNLWEELQAAVDCLIDREGKMSGEQGLKQIIEKKAGVIRMHMMGKRVNFAARSVITPDPNLNVDEIGIPESFAKLLTYPVAVTSWNVEELRKMIMNGPNVHPGAVTVEFEDGKVIRINPADLTQQESILKRLLTPDGPDKAFRGVKMVHRHLCNGDILLLNRQPTLHKPSIMAHTARILKGEKTLRLHYANCKAYNADFDGDEMNAHFPQNELARSEAYTLANVSNQYLVPKDGTPLSGLIQDHMIAGVKISMRGKFFNKYDYHQMVYQALSYKTTQIKLLPPSILKPEVLWSGKQVLSTVILNVIPKDRAPINLTATSKIPAKAWEKAPARRWKAGGSEFARPNDMTEGEVIIRRGELLVGILDKTHYGATPYGLVHCMYELYGGTYSSKLLSSLAKLFMYFLQREGFTLGVHDILVQTEADRIRSRIIKRNRKIGKSVMAEALNMSADTDLDALVDKMEEQAAGNPKFRAIVDRQYKSSLDSYTNDINKACLPAGLICKFPENNLQLMVQSGAKGSTVNTMQISCLLGQIELEGKRPPVTISEQALPSFPLHEFSPRAGGFIDGRFLTGIQPQEFFFHCMAGREGLVDTAVKTSRSGYLQRCLIKHLEGLTVGYDLTVRDSDRSVIQFNYGEDGMDIAKAQFLNAKQMSFLAENSGAIVDDATLLQLKQNESYKKIAKRTKKINKWNAKHVNCRGKCTDSGKCPRKPDPVVASYQPDAHFGAINERLRDLIEKSANRHEIEQMLQVKAMQSLAAPGEPVGLLAAQSIGEPSTQMTLNTFHFAGRGEMNVTLGIPRLREILMMASKNIKTPSMEVPFLDVPRLDGKADKLRKILTRVVVADVLEKIDVTQELELQPARQHKITLRFQIMPHELYKKDYNVKPKRVINYMGDKFFKLMFIAIRKYAKVNTNLVTVDEKKAKVTSSNGEDDERMFNMTQRDRPAAGDISSDEDEPPEDAEDAKMATKYEEGLEDQEPDEEEILNDDSDSEEDSSKKGFFDDEAVQDDLTSDEVNAIRNAVVNKHVLVNNYVFDTKNYTWCELTFALPISYKKLDLTEILREVAGKAVLWETPGIKRAITYMKDDRLTLRTDGINLVELFKYNQLLDLNKLYSNDIHKVAETYGIEAATRVIIKEVRDVFSVYGIAVDPRHLSLISDYMTYGGSFEPLSRKGMESSASPFQQMSFESSLTFLRAAAIAGRADKLDNPSSCLMVGKPCNSGTGSFTLMQNFQMPATTLG